MNVHKLAWFILLLAQTAAAQTTDTIPVKEVKKPDGFRSLINQVYTEVDGWKGRMDIYLPPAGGSPAPLLINIHGGAWAHGNKESQTGFYSFFKNGFAVANVEYRMAPTAPAPAAIEDTRCALHYLVQHAKELNIDPNRIVVMGGSAGGHLALMTGLLQNKSEFDRNCPAKTDSFRIAAIIDKYGPADLTIIEDLDHIRRSAYSWLRENVKNRQFLQSISPVYRVSKNSPPVFVVHGDADPTVPYRQSVLLTNKLKEQGVKYQFITVPGGLHGKFSKEESSSLSKSIQAFLVSCGIIQ